MDWRQRSVIWLLGVIGVGCLPGVAQAESEVDILLNKLVEKGVLSNVEAGQIRREIGETKEDRNKQIAKEIVPDSSRNWKWGGDIRLREEYRNRTGTGQDINRQRIRFRYGFDAKVSDDVRVGARLATGSTSDPVSTNQTFDTAFNHKTILLDRAFVDYSPPFSGLDRLTLTGGIIENPFWLVGPLAWDDDMNFDGAAVKLEKNLGSVATLFTNDGMFLLESGITEAPSLWSLQAGVIVKPFSDAEDEVLKNFKMTGALSYHDYKNLDHPASEQPNGGSVGTGSTIRALAGGAKGNTTGTKDFNLFNPTFELSSQYADVPFGLFGDWVHNTAVAIGADGFQIGVKLGKARIPFDLLKGWEGGYFFERLAPDATFGPFTDSDFGNGGTNHRGHVWWMKFATMKNSVVQLKYFNIQELKGSKSHADTFQADWVTKF